MLHGHTAATRKHQAGRTLDLHAVASSPAPPATPDAVAPRRCLFLSLTRLLRGSTAWGSTTWVRPSGTRPRGLSRWASPGETGCRTPRAARPNPPQIGRAHV